MKIIGDEHMSPRIVRAVSDLALKRGWSIEHVIGSSYQSRADEDWVSAFANSGGNVFLSADRQMLKRPALISKISELNLIGIYLPSDWAQSKRHLQAAHILYWWPKIEATLETCAPGTAWNVPKGFGGGDLRQFEPKARKSNMRIA